MRLMHFTSFVFVSGALFLGGCGLVALGQINDTARKSSIPPETAREMTELKRLLQESPGDPAVLFTLATDYATIGEKAKAIELLEEMSLAHAGLDPQSAAGRAFVSIQNDPRFRALVARIEKGNPPIVHSTKVFVLKEKNLAPEGIAYDSVGRKFYISSVSKRKIVVVGEVGSIAVFALRRRFCAC